MNRFTQTLTGLAVAASVLSAVFASVPITEERFGVNWGSELYTPYAVTAILAISFRRNVEEAAISLVGSVTVGLAVFAMRATGDALAFQLCWFLSLLGCVVVLLTQFVRRGIRNGRQSNNSRQREA